MGSLGDAIVDPGMPLGAGQSSVSASGRVLIAARTCLTGFHHRHGPTGMEAALGFRTPVSRISSNGTIEVAEGDGDAGMR